MRMFDDDVVVIAGGGSGLGLGVARHCLADGARIAILEVSADKVTDLRAEFGDRAVVVQCDVADADAVRTARRQILDAYGRVDAMIGCQGIFDGQVPLKDMPVERLGAAAEEVFRVNVIGYLLLAKVFQEDLARVRGALVLTASVAAYAADGGGSIYSASKGAIRSLVGQLAYEFAPDVRVNGVAPAGIANSQLRGPEALGLQDAKQSDIPRADFVSVFRNVSLLTELPTPEEHGPLYAFLASRHNAIMTGQVVVADQGLLNRTLLSGVRHRPSPEPDERRDHDA